jgi:hypothetical protein
MNARITKRAETDKEVDAFFMVWLLRFELTIAFSIPNLGKNSY